MRYRMSTHSGDVSYHYGRKMSVDDSQNSLFIEQQI
jgi:hypothetical protein